MGKADAVRSDTRDILKSKRYTVRSFVVYHNDCVRTPLLISTHFILIEVPHPSLISVDVQARRPP